ncbi:right-handed parallel beta-helix repeat-containing protein [Flavisolibacter ginsenosidimutans]|nr:right-handed parallel beta-helix repeat-containing protein [Flavisolibacter ginsenosidimutans]
MKQEKCSKAPHNTQADVSKSIIFLLAASLLFVTGCKKELTSNNAESDKAESLAMQANNAKAPAIVVQPGTSIQAAINAVPNGSVIKILQGTYSESIVVNKPGITLTGEGNVVIQNPGDVSIGIQVVKGADGFALSNVTVQGFKDRAVEIKEINGLLLSHVTAIGNNKEEFGLFVQYCTNGTIEHCEATGHTDTGIFVGESTGVSLAQNESFANTIGIETENASRITIDKNHMHDNSAGILCLLVPGKSTSESSNITITKNQIRDNNHANLQTDPSELEFILPTGIGILILGVDNMLVEDNHVTGNQYTGIGVVTTAILGPTPGIDPVSDNVKVVSNQVKNNGFNPQSLYFPTYFASDLLWLGPDFGATGTGNCWSKNLYDTSFPATLPSCQ